MRITTTAILAAFALSGTAYAQSATTPPPGLTAPANPANRAPIAAPTPDGTPSQTVTPTLSVGDLVMLKSGSPYMTVIETGADVQVVWYGQEKGPQRERFPAAVLEKMDLGESDEHAPTRQREASSPDREHDDRQIDRSRRDEGMYRDRRSEGRYETNRHQSRSESRRESRYGDRDWDHRCHCDDGDDGHDRDYRR